MRWQQGGGGGDPGLELAVAAGAGDVESSNEGEVDVEGAARAAGAPAQYFCSICTDLMRDPVIVATGQTYERKAIVNWVRSCEVSRKTITCPVTRQVLPHETRTAIRDFELVQGKDLHKITYYDISSQLSKKSQVK